MSTSRRPCLAPLLLAMASFLSFLTLSAALASAISSGFCWVAGGERARRCTQLDTLSIAQISRATCRMNAPIVVGLLYMNMKTEHENHVLLFYLGDEQQCLKPIRPQQMYRNLYPASELDTQSSNHHIFCEQQVFASSKRVTYESVITPPHWEPPTGQSFTHLLCSYETYHLSVPLNWKGADRHHLCVSPSQKDVAMKPIAKT